MSVGNEQPFCKVFSWKATPCLSAYHSRQCQCSLFPLVKLCSVRRVSLQRRTCRDNYRLCRFSQKVYKILKTGCTLLYMYMFLSSGWVEVAEMMFSRIVEDSDGVQIARSVAIRLVLACSHKLYFCTLMYTCTC